LPKFQNVLRDEPKPARRSSSAKLIVLGTLLALSPLVLEAGLTVASSWQSMLGRSWEPNTPFFDAIAGGGRDTGVALRGWYAHLFQSGTWRPGTAVPLAIGWAVAMGVLFLRRGR
jgi:hypothetical protein